MNKTKKRGFVMTGGGAKGLYEAGVIHAFHLTGMEFDVITGSSIGAMNSAFYAEYLYQKRGLSPAVLADPLQAVEALDPLVKAYHHAWLLMPDKRVIDDSPEGPLGKLKDDLLRFDLSLPQLTRLGWWWTDPQRGKIPEPGVWPAVLKLLRELVERLGGAGQVLRIFKEQRAAPLQEAIRTYLRRFGMDRSLIPPGEDGKIRDIFTQPVSSLRPEHLVGAMTADEPGVKKYILVDPERTLRDYARLGIDVRLTRANYRTGRLEISAYVPLESFVRFMRKQIWRLSAYDPKTIPLGSFRLPMPGNPNAVNAALCSGRFPGVFTPFPITEIYLANDPENALLYRLLNSSPTQNPEPADQSRAPQVGDEEYGWDELFANRADALALRDFFPVEADVYVDGGAIDNTPSNSAVDYVREWAEQTSHSKREVELELFVIFLGAEPKITPVEATAPNFFQVVQRTLEIQGVAKQTSDANTVSTINTFGQRGAELGQALKLVLESYQENLGSLGEAQRGQIESGLRAKARQMDLEGYLGREAEGILGRMERWADKQLAQALPLHVDEVKIYPQEMPLSTLQFTERLGYRQENALKMLTMGCYNALWTLQAHLEAQKEADLDDRDRVALGLVRRWTGIEGWPKDQPDQEALHQAWQCRRTACVFHAEKCAHGRKVAA
jgi:hypothetical protein